MHIEQELRQWLEQNISEKNQKSRNIEIVINYYGFGELAWPTLDEIAEKFSIGTRERVRQIINAAFRKKISLKQLPIASQVFDNIEANHFISTEDLRTNLSQKGIISSSTTIRGILNLARDLGRCDGYSLHDSALEQLSRSEAEFDSKTFLIHAKSLPDLKEGLRKARTLPGTLGLSRFEYLRSEVSNEQTYKNILSLIQADAKAVRINTENGTWYIYEDRDNTLINSCEKIFTLADSLNIDTLASTLQNSLRRRSNKHEYPKAEVILEWIQRSKWFKVSGDAVEFIGEKGVLTDLEKSVTEYLSDRDYALYPELSEHLSKRGHGKPAIDKAVTTSPLVAVDKSGQRKSFKYSLISKTGAINIDNETANRYSTFKNRLKSLLAIGTDRPVEGMARREQAILREWLFGDSTKAECAICQETFSTNALVAAHKKKRTLCSDAERVDPYIVFPLCVFGCDYLFETGALKIKEGKVVLGKYDQIGTTDYHRAQSLCGKALLPKWIRGDSSYFEAD